jgi:hypothetical protein
MPLKLCNKIYILRLGKKEQNELDQTSLKGNMGYFARRVGVVFTCNQNGTTSARVVKGINRRCNGVCPPSNGEEIFGIFMLVRQGVF